jgi:antitoxin HicB
MKYHFKITNEARGFSAQCIELPGCITEGDTREELERNMEEALNLYIEEPEDSTDLAALPDKSIKPTKNIVEVKVAPKIAFSFLMRYYRITHGLTQQEAADRIGFNTIYNYQKLETSAANPTLATIAKIKEAFPDFSVDYALAS